MLFEGVRPKIRHLVRSGTVEVQLNFDRFNKHSFTVNSWESLRTFSELKKTIEISEEVNKHRRFKTKPLNVWCSFIQLMLFYFFKKATQQQQQP